MNPLRTDWLQVQRTGSHSSEHVYFNGVGELQFVQCELCRWSVVTAWTWVGTATPCCCADGVSQINKETRKIRQVNITQNASKHTIAKKDYYQAASYA